MKVIYTCFFLLVTTFVTAQEDMAYVDVNQVEVLTTTPYKKMWEASFERATKLAKKQNKPILIFFSGSDWCGPCRMLNADFFESQQFIKMADEMILYEADFPRDRSKLTREQMKVNAKLGTIYDVNSFPTILMITAEGDELGRQKGYTLLRETRAHFAFLNRTLNH